MKFDRFDQKLRAVLTGEDLRRLSLTYEEIDYGSSNTRLALLRLLEEAHIQIGYDPPETRLFVEVYPYDDGCVVYFSAAKHAHHDASSSTRLVAEPVVFTFPGCEEMITACTKVFRQCCHRIHKSALYHLEGQYRLVVYPLDGEVRLDRRDSASINCLAEFGELTGEGEMLAAYVAEHGTPIAEENAIDKISYYLA